MNAWTQLVLATTCAIGLAACNTMQGAGKDIERGGEKVQDAASRRQRLHHGAGRIAGSGTGAGQGNTELAACPGVSIGCIHRGGFVAHGDEGKFTVHGFHQWEVTRASLDIMNA